MPQVLLDEDAKRLLDIEKQRLRENGRPGASLSDAVRALEAGDCHRRPRGNAGGA